MRIRNLRPEFWADRQLAKQTSRDARLLYHGLWNLADEEGRAPGSAEYIKGVIFPYETDIDNDDVDAMLNELAAAGKVVRYVAGGDPYLWLPNLGRHNRLDPVKTPSKLPPPVIDDGEPPLPGLELVQNDSGISPERVRNDSALARAKQAGRRGKGEGKRGEGAREAAPPRFCSGHPGGTREPCGACARAREAHKAWRTNRHDVTLPAPHPFDDDGTGNDWCTCGLPRSNKVHPQ